MKIKTITCHNVYNIGASLQAYALMEYLQGLGHNVEIIDYVPEYLTHYRLNEISNSTYDRPILRELYLLIKLPRRLKEKWGRRKREFDCFSNRYLKVTQRSYRSFEELQSDPPQADIIFAGSDQIWNTFFRNGKDPAFYLQFAPKGCIRAAYAASFATETIANKWKPQIKRWLGELDFISVREISGVKIVQELGINRAVQVVDPVFLLDRHHWSMVAYDIPMKRPYVLVYDFDNCKDIAEFAKQIARKNRCTVYSVLKNPFISHNFASKGPQTFLTLIKNAEVIISNSFHATAFSLIFEKEFWVIPRREEINTRMVDLLRLVGLVDRLINDLQMQKIEDKKIDYGGVNMRLIRAIIRSQEYINKVLEIGKQYD